MIGFLVCHPFQQSRERSMGNLFGGIAIGGLTIFFNFDGYIEYFFYCKQLNMLLIVRLIVSG